MVDPRRRGAAVGAALAVVLVIGGAGTATAQSVTEAQLRALAERAVDDPRALAQLRGVQQVDGRPVEVGRALSGAEGPALQSRLRTLAGGGDAAGSAIAAGEARGDAEAVLQARRFQPSRVPRPLAGILRTLGRWLQPVAGPLRDLWEPISRNLGAQLVFVAVVFAVAALTTLRLVGRRGPQSLHRSRPAGPDGQDLDPEALERDAAAAERAGDLERAVRLRFVAGVLRLDRAGVISYRPSLTSGQLRARVPSPSFGQLAAAFDEIVYGGRPAGESDVERARTEWPRVVAGARR